MQSKPTQREVIVRMPIGIALVGAGHWGTNHLKALKTILNSGQIEKLVVCDTRSDVGDRVSSEFDVQFTTDINEILNDEEITAVDLVTSTSTHYDLSKRIIVAGKDVLVEKPLAYTSSECDDIIELAKEHNRILMVGHIFRYHPAIKMLVDQISRGRFGEIRNIDIERLAFQPPKQDMGVLHALAIHDVDLACLLFNEKTPKSIFAVSQSFHTENPDEMSIIIMDFGKGRIAKIESSWLNPVAHKKRTLELIGSKGSAFIDFLKPQALTVYSKSFAIDENETLEVKDDGESELIAEEGMPLNLELEHFISCIKNRRTPNTNGQVGRNAVRMIECALESLKTGVPIEF
jgi:predicted dehydrogenase